VIGNVCVRERLKDRRCSGMRVKRQLFQQWLPRPGSS
jgi:hypothetical protein